MVVGRLSVRNFHNLETSTAPFSHPLVGRDVLRLIAPGRSPLLSLRRSAPTTHCKIPRSVPWSLRRIQRRISVGRDIRRSGGRGCKMRGERSVGRSVGRSANSQPGPLILNLAPKFSTWPSLSYAANFRWSVAAKCPSVAAKLSVGPLVRKKFILLTN